MQLSTSKENFIFNMKKDGYITEWEENKKHIIFTAEKSILQGKKNKFRLANLEKTFNISDFNKENLLEIFKLNQEKERKNILEKISSEKENVKTNNYGERKKGYALEL